MPADDVQVCIVGGGVGGLSLAGFLRAHGIEPVVVERADEWDVPGHGMTLPGSGLAALRELGISGVGNRVGAWTMRDPDGSVRVRLEADGNGDRLVAVSRSALHERLRELVPDRSVRMGTTVAALDQTAPGVEVTFSDRVREQFDVVVGADGARSQVRELLGAGGPAAAGTESWTFPVDAPDAPEEATEVWGPESTALLYLPLDDGGVAWLTARADGDERGATPEALRETFGGIGWLLPEVLDGLDADEVWHAPDYRVRTDTWVDGRVALLGDAAHAVHPVSGLGATLTMEDARVLADELAGRDDAIDVRLADYAGRRRSRVRRLEREVSLAEWFALVESPLASTLRDALALRSTVLESGFGDGDGHLLDGR